MNCPFCSRIHNGEYDGMLYDVVHFEPLNPVTDGHLLFVPVEHIEPAARLGALRASRWAAAVTGRTFDAAVIHASGHREPYNLITSAGAEATQTVPHLHVHYVPRRENDGLHLPWTGQRTQKPLAPLTGRPDLSGLPFVEAWREADRAHAKHGDSSMRAQPADALLRLSILTEEVGEVAKEFNDARHRGESVDLGRLRTELIQVAAMAGDWVASIDQASS